VGYGIVPVMLGLGTQAPGSSKLYVSGSSTSLVNLRGYSVCTIVQTNVLALVGVLLTVRFHIQETIGGINKVIYYKM